MSAYTLRRATAIGALFTALIGSSCLAVAPAAAEKPARIKAMSINAHDATKELRVYSKDGIKWDSFRNTNIPFIANVVIDTKGSGFIWNAAIVIGQCGDEQCQAFPPAWKKVLIERDYTDTVVAGFSGASIPLPSADAIPIMPQGGQILDRCNQHLSGDGPNRKHTFQQKFRATLIADTDRAVRIGNIPEEAGDDGFPKQVDEWRGDDFNVNVVCEPIKKTSVDDVAALEPDFKPTDVKLFLATVNGMNTDGPNPATTCPALKVTTRVQTTKAGGVDIRLWRREGNGPITNEFKSAWASFDAAKNGYFADFVRVEKFDATTHMQFMAETVGGTFVPSTPWKDITVHCTGAGGGGLANDMPNTGEDPLPPPKPDKPKPQVDTGSNDLADQARPGDDKPKKSWDGTVTLADSAGTKKHCPRKGQVMFDVSRNAPGSFKYKISCSNGQGFGGSVASFDQGSGIFHAIAAHDLNINRTHRIQCTLQEVKESGVRVTIDKGSFDYTCNNPALDPQADDLATPQNPPKPTHAEDKPDVSIFCKPGFMLKGKACVKKPEIVVLCKSGEVLKGKTCIKKPAVSILCKPGFMLKDQKCVKKPTVSILCVKGYKLVNNTCVKQPVITANTKKKPLRLVKRQDSN